MFAVSMGETSEGDGNTTNVDFYKGFSLGRDGYLGVTVNYRDRERTSRANPQGGCLYGGCVDSDGNGYLEPAPGNETREVSGSGRNGFRIGDADSQQVAIVVNAGMPLGDDGELYSFVTYSGRDGQSGAFYRNPAGSGAALSDGENVIPDGFLPLINSEINDISYNVGYRTEFDDGSAIDFSYTSGRNSIDYTTSNSANYSFVNELRFGQGLSDADIRAQIPRSAPRFARMNTGSCQVSRIPMEISIQSWVWISTRKVRVAAFRVSPESRRRVRPTNHLMSFRFTSTRSIS